MCTLFVADKKKLQYIKMTYQLNMLFEGVSSAIGYCEVQYWAVKLIVFTK